MPRKPRKPKSSTPKPVEALSHPDARRRHIPTAELQSFVADDEAAPRPLRYPRNVDLDPQLVWRGKDEQDGDDLIVDTVPIYIQEKIKPEAIVADLKRRSDRARRERAEADEGFIPDLFHDFNGLPDKEAELEFYEHDKNWSNQMILGDSLLVMNSLADKEALKGQVQCIYFDPPYGIKFNSNWQPSTKSRDVKDGAADSLSREPEMIRAFRDTWSDGIHSYLSYLRDRLTVARELLTESGSIFVQIGDENVHLVRALMDEVFGVDCSVVIITVKKKGAQKSSFLDPVNDYILWYSRRPRSDNVTKFRSLFERRELDEDTLSEFSRLSFSDGAEVPIAVLERQKGERGYYRRHPDELLRDYPEARPFRPWPITNGGSRTRQNDPINFQGRLIPPPSGRCWSHTSVSDDGSVPGMYRVIYADRLVAYGKSADFKRFLQDFAYKGLSNWWDNLGGAPDPIYVVQTNEEIVKRCILMTTDPGDLVLDPTCGSGTTAYVAEQWGRRWITMDTSRVALALARQRLMAGRFPSYLLKDSPEGALKEAELAGTAMRAQPSPLAGEGAPEPARGRVRGSGEAGGTPPHPAAAQPPSPTRGEGKSASLTAGLASGRYTRSVRQGFVYERSRWITSGSIANNAEIDVIWETWLGTLQPLLDRLNAALGEAWEEWEVPREAAPGWAGDVVKLHAEWWAARRTRQAEIDASIARNADTEYLVDRPYEDGGKVRVTGPFTVESLSPHRVLPADEDPWIEEALAEETEGRALPKRTKSLTRSEAERIAEQDFTRVVLDNLKKSGVQNTKKGETLHFTELKPWPGGRYVHAEGRYVEGGQDKGRGASETSDRDTPQVEKRAAITIGPEYGTVSYGLVREAAREAVELFDTLVVCGFAFEPRVNDEMAQKFGRLTVLRARMNNELHMKEALKATGAGNLFVVFGEPDICIEETGDGRLVVEILGVDIFDPTTGEVRSSNVDDIACWFVDTDYDEESFFVRQAYFLGGNDPYKRLKTTLKAEIDEEAWETLYSAVSRPFDRPETGRIAVKVINHYGDEVLKVFEV